MCEPVSLVSALSTFLPLLAATPEPALPSLLPQLATLRAALLATLQEQEEQEEGDESGLGKTMLEGEVKVQEAVSVEEVVEVPRWLAPGMRRVQLVLQGGPSYELTKTRVEAAMGEFGALESCTLAHSSNRVGASGWVVYRQEAAALRALHRLVQVVRIFWRVHCSPGGGVLGVHEARLQGAHRPPRAAPGAEEGLVEVVEELVVVEVVDLTCVWPGGDDAQPPCGALGQGPPGQAGFQDRPGRSVSCMHGLPPYPAPAGAPDLRPARRGGGGGVEVERRHTQVTRQL